jgi:hypothetical protein
MKMSLAAVQINSQLQVVNLIDRSSTHLRPGMTSFSELTNKNMNLKAQSHLGLLPATTTSAS